MSNNDKYIKDMKLIEESLSDSYAEMMKEAFTTIVDSCTVLGWAVGVSSDEWDDPKDGFVSGLIIGKDSYVEYVASHNKDLNLVRLERNA